MHKIVCVDLDGTISHYVEWVDETTFGSLVLGADLALRELKSKGYTIIIYTTRGNKKLIAEFLGKNGIPFDYINENPNQPKNAIGGKPIADIYVDDRGLQFNGDWKDTLNKILSFKTWEEVRKEQNEQLEYSKQFLYHDFEQCFQQMRHYDSQCWDIIKFCYGEVLLAVTAIWALYCFSTAPENVQALVFVHFNWLTFIIFFISYIFVFISSYLVARNRVYYVKTSRYVNEFRKLATDTQPYGFKNMYGFYDDYNLPRVYERKSTQLVALYSIVLLGLLCFGGLAIAFVLGMLQYSMWINSILLAVLFLLGYIPFHWGCFVYLKKENKKMSLRSIK